MTDLGKVSVILGVYNCGSTLLTALESIAAQTYPYWEIIICDDCSEDNTYQVAQCFFAKYPYKVKLLRNEHRAHLAYCLNRCLEYAEGTYIARLDGDDYCANNRFERQVSYLNEHPQIDLCGTAMQIFDKYGKFNRIAYCPQYPNSFTLHYTIPFFHATIMARHSVFSELVGYTDLPRTIRCEDRDLWFRFFYSGLCGSNMSDVLYYVREDDSSIRRRTPSARWNLFLTELCGYKLLKYPWYWYYKPLVNLLKILVPIHIQVFRQHLINKKGKRL